MSARRAARALVCAGLLVGGPGCSGEAGSDRDQWVVSVTTDAPIPQLGERLLVEVLDPQGQLACNGCRITLGAPAVWPASFGIVAGGGPEKGQGSATFVRARLYRAAYAGTDGLPRGPAVIDGLGRLPPAKGKEDVLLPLSLGCFGVPSDPEGGLTCDPGTMALSPALELSPPRAPLPLPGSSPLARVIPCSEPPPEGMACVDGAAFLLGTAQGFALGVLQPSPERLVVLSPFALDTEEMSVGQVRTLVQRGAVTGEPTIRNDDPTLSACTYLGRDDPANDALPVTCVGHRLASDVCAALGRRLPTEAEWELAAGNGTRETTFPWGEGSDVCAHAVVARGRALVPEVLEETSCLDGSFRSTGPVPGGSDKDVTGIGIYNLGGNVSEWVEDRFAPYASPCLGDGSTLEDPVCRTASSDTHVVRGGSWASRPLIARSTSRNGARAATGDPYIGFRCALTLAE